MNRRLAYLLLAWGAACAQGVDPAPAAEPLPPVKVTAAIDKAVATTGDILTYSIELDRDAQLTVTLPEPGADIAGFRILDAGSEPSVTKRGRTLERHWYKLRADLVGSYILPPVVAHYRAPIQPAAPDVAADTNKAPPPPDAAAQASETSVSTSAIFVEVKSVLPQDGEAKDIRDLKPLQPMPAPRWPYWLASGIGLTLMLVVASVIWMRKRRKALVVPPVPPHEVAYAALSVLRHTDFTDPEAVRRYFFGISDVLRSYVEARFGLNATDLTTEEILPRLGELQTVAGPERVKLKETLMAADQVKFADHPAGTTDIEQAYERALSFVEATTAATPPSPNA